jgi:hypothetical protein
VKWECKEPNTPVEIDTNGNCITAFVTPLPFYSRL